MSSTSTTLALESWLHSHAATLHPSLRILHSPTSGVHMRATGPLPPSTLLATSPHSLSLSCLTALADDAYPVFRTQNHRFRGEAIGFFYLMAQYLRREESFWKPYLDTLPAPDLHEAGGLTQPLFFEDAKDVAWLEGTDVWHTVVARGEVYGEYFRHGIDVLKEAGVDTGGFTWHLFKWAASMYTSRAFSSRSLRPQTGHIWTTYKTSASPQGITREAVPIDMTGMTASALHFPVLFPGLDAANHDHNAKVDWNFGPTSFSVALAKPGESNGIAAGAEVFNNYGPKSNGELLIGYGFCLPSNPYDTVAMTLKPPPAQLQEALRPLHPTYFNDETGAWNPQKSTFHLLLPSIPKQTHSGLAQRPQIFHRLPEPLLELLTHIIRHERGIPFTPLPQPLLYLTSPDSDGRRYLPHIARMIVVSLGPKGQKLRASRPAGESQEGNRKQAFAAMYRDGQVVIIDALVAALKAYTKALIYRPPPQLGTSAAVVELPTPRGPTLVSLPAFLNLLRTHHVVDIDAFLRGIEVAAGSPLLPTLRAAGWEEDLWVLLLSYLLLDLAGLPSWLRAAFGEYVDVTTSSAIPATGGNGGDPDLQEAAASVLDVVRVAAAADPTSRWGREEWTPEFVARTGGAVVRYESFVAMVAASLTGYHEGGAGGPDEEEAGLFMYFHFPLEG